MSETQILEKVSISGVELQLTPPIEIKNNWIGQNEPLEQILASWNLIDPKDLALHPRLVGKPGVGKTTLACSAADKLGRSLYIFQCTMDTRPEDLIISPVISAEGKISYSASPLVSAMIKGGIVLLDEANRMSEKAWASLAPLLDHRRYVESVVAGIRIQAHEKFCLCATMNEDSSTYDLPEYINSRLKPQIYLEYPDSEEELRILKQNLPYVREEILTYVVNFLQKAHHSSQDYTLRDGINIARFAAKRLNLLNLNPSPSEIDSILRQSITLTLGDEAALYGD